MPVPAVIFDVDGTLADVSGVRHYVTSDPRKKNFEKFHSAASFCTPHAAVVQLAQQLKQSGFDILVFTSRKERWRYKTQSWLRKWEIPVDALAMRDDTDNRKDYAVKSDLLQIARTVYDWNPVLAVDDNPNVLQLWQDEGIPAVEVLGWVHDRG